MRKSEGRALPVVAAIAAVAALILGASLLQGLVTAREGVVTSPIGDATPVAGRTTDLDLGQVSSEEQVAACLTPDFASDPSRVTLLYGVQQRRYRHAPRLRAPPTRPATCGCATVRHRRPRPAAPAGDLGPGSRSRSSPPAGGRGSAPAPPRCSTGSG